MDARMDEDRIERIARAMCRSARKNPDERLFDPEGVTTGSPARAASTRITVPAWFQFRASAERFVAAHAIVAERL